MWWSFCETMGHHHQAESFFFLKCESSFGGGKKERRKGQSLSIEREQKKIVLKGEKKTGEDQ